MPKPPKARPSSAWSERHAKETQPQSRRIGAGRQAMCAHGQLPSMAAGTSHRICRAVAGQVAVAGTARRRQRGGARKAGPEGRGQRGRGQRGGFRLARAAAHLREGAVDQNSRDT